MQQQSSAVVYCNQSGCCENTSYVVLMELLRLTLVLPPFAFFLFFCFKQMDLTNVQCWSTYRYGSSAKCIARSMSAAMVNGRIFISSSMNLDNGIDIICGTQHVTNATHSKNMSHPNALSSLVAALQVNDDPRLMRLINTLCLL